MEIITSDDEDEDDNGAKPAVCAPAPPRASRPSLPSQSATAPIAGPSAVSARNIEFVLPAPGRRFLSLRVQPLPIQEVFDLSLVYLALKIYTDDAFPDRRTRADMKFSSIISALRDLGETYQDIESRIWKDDQYMRTFTSLVRLFDFF